MRCIGRDRSRCICLNATAACRNFSIGNRPPRQRYPRASLPPKRRSPYPYQGASPVTKLVEDRSRFLKITDRGSRGGIRAARIRGFPAFSKVRLQRRISFGEARIRAHPCRAGHADAWSPFCPRSMTRIFRDTMPPFWNIRFTILHRIPWNMNSPTHLSH